MFAVNQVAFSAKFFEMYFYIFIEMFLLTGCAVYSIDKRVQKEFDIKRVSIINILSVI